MGDDENEEVDDINGDAKYHMRSDGIVNQPILNTVNGDAVKESEEKEAMLNPEDGQSTNSKNRGSKSQNGPPNDSQNGRSIISKNRGSKSMKANSQTKNEQNMKRGARSQSQKDS